MLTLSFCFCIYFDACSIFKNDYIFTYRLTEHMFINHAESGLGVPAQLFLAGLPEHFPFYRGSGQTMAQKM